MPYMVHSKEVEYLGSKPRLFDNNDQKKKKKQKTVLKPNRTKSILSWGAEQEEEPS